ncbi:Flavin-binding monooxygenase family protein [Euphorbia peplus]|nr:Flavin-binding monooxygenase family protein [Euphorbia peplus]
MTKSKFIKHISRYNHFSKAISFYSCLGKWHKATNEASSKTELYYSNFIIIASGENNVSFIPKVTGLESFTGKVIHSNEYRNGGEFQGKQVLIVGCGNSGMEINFDPPKYGANPSIVIQIPFYVVTREMIYFGMILLKYIPMKYVDALMTLWITCEYGDLSLYGILRASVGPFLNKVIMKKTLVIDVGTVRKIQVKKIKVVPEIVCVKENMVEFSSSTTQDFDLMIFATGYKSVVDTWIKIFIKSSKEEMETTVIIVGAGPAGLATSACLNNLCIPNIIIEKETCSASLWRLHSYDCVHLHLAKQFCELPYAPHESDTPTFMPKSKFIEYIDNYTLKNKINPLYGHFVEAASFDNCLGRWRVKAMNKDSGETEVYYSKFIVIASGENNVGFIPRVIGLESFTGKVIHSNEYRNGGEFQGKQVLVVGCGNSGMEISFDLAKHGANASIVIRSPFHVVTREMVYFGMVLLKYIPMKYVDALVALWARIKYGDLSPYGICRPSIGPFLNKIITGKTPVIDVGTVKKIQSKEIKVVPEIVCVKENMVEFSDNSTQHFDVMVFATGYKSVANTWLKDNHYIMNDKSMPKNPSPMHWKGENRSYCVGFSRNGLNGISRDAMTVATEISLVLLKDPIPELQGLANLRELFLVKAFEGEYLYFPEGFDHLEVLRLINFPALRRIHIAKGAMSGLKELKIIYCSDLEMIPGGVIHLNHLRELYLWGVSKQVAESISAPSGVDFPSVHHIAEVDCWDLDQFTNWIENAE